MRKLVIGMAMASTALASPALARDGQWYVEVNGGPMVVEDITLDVNSGAGELDVQTDPGYDFGGLVGYDFGGFRLETEASYREADVLALAPGTVGVAFPNGSNTGFGVFDAAGDVNVLSFMLNGLVDFGDDDGLQGFVGAGAGVARTDLHAILEPASGRTIDDSDTGFAWQILAGARAPLSDSWDVGLRYRMFNADNISLVDAVGRNLEGKLRTHSILGTLTYNFGGAPEPVVAPPPPPPAAVAPPPPPPPPPPPVAAIECNKGPYIVFFEWDQSDVTPEAATILNSAVSAYANCGSAAVMLAGHADSSGAKAYNVGLSERRNAAVTEYLAGRGIPAARISSEAFGETSLPVPTADGVRELQNRRVSVSYGPGSGM